MSEAHLADYRLKRNDHKKLTKHTRKASFRNFVEDTDNMTEAAKMIKLLNKQSGKALSLS